MSSDRVLRPDSLVFVPSQAAFRSELPQLHHDDPDAGHLGVTKSFDLLRRHLTWNGIARDVTDLCWIVRETRYIGIGRMASCNLNPFVYLKKIRFMRLIQIELQVFQKAVKTASREPLVRVRFRGHQLYQISLNIDQLRYLRIRSMASTESS